MTILTDTELAAGAAQQDALAWQDDVALGAARLLAAVALAPDPKPTREGRTTPQVADLARITYRQLEHWTTHGYLGTMPATGTGNPRNWSDQQTRRAIIMAALVHAGLTIPAAARHAPHALDGPWTVIGLPGLDLKIHTQRILQRAGLLDEQTETVQPTSEDPDWQALKSGWGATSWRDMRAIRRTSR